MDVDVDTKVFDCVGCLESVVVYGVGGLDDVTFVGILRDGSA